MSINKVRGLLYRLARLLGDVKRRREGPPPRHLGRALDGDGRRREPGASESPLPGDEGLIR